jgi:hypothetical protein
VTKESGKYVPAPLRERESNEPREKRKEESETTERKKKKREQKKQFVYMII